MKSAAPNLSTEQKRVQGAYKLAWWPAMLWVGLTWVLMCILVEVVARLCGWKGGFNPGGLVVLIFPLVHLLAIRKLKRQGISLAAEKIEVLKRLNLPFETNNTAIEWRAPKTLIGSVAKESGFLLTGAACWLFWRFPLNDLGIKLISGVGGVLFLLLGGVGLIFVRHSRVRIDSDGITALQNLRIPRRVLWRDIKCCEVRSVWDYLGNGPARSLTLHSSEGKKLLLLNAAVLSSLSREEQDEIVREIRRRFAEDDANE